MPTPSLASLLVQQTKAQIYSAALTIAQTLGLPVTSWQPGDPTRSLFFVEAALLEVLENVVVGFISSGFLDHATGAWLKVLAKQVFNVDVPDATYAETVVTLVNGGGGVYFLEPGDLTLKSSASGATYHNTTGGTLNSVGTPGATLVVSVIADVAGSGSTAGAGEIDTLVTTLSGVSCYNAAAAIGIDEQDAITTRAQCRNKLGSLSPNGPAAAYSFVAQNSELTGTTTVTRSRVYHSSETGDVVIYVASPSGSVSSLDLDAVRKAITTNATPLCITPTVLSAVGVTVPISYTIWVYNSVNRTTDQIKADISDALATFFAKRAIGGDIIPPATTGAVYRSMIESTIGALYPTQTFRVSVTLPSGEVTALANDQVAQLGDIISPVVNHIPDP